RSAYPVPAKSLTESRVQLTQVVAAVPGVPGVAAPVTPTWCPTYALAAVTFNGAINVPAANAVVDSASRTPSRRAHGAPPRSNRASGAAVLVASSARYVPVSPAVAASV